MVKRLVTGSIGVMVLALAIGCGAASGERPIQGGPIDAGPGSVTAARKFLQGRWSLEQFEVFPPGRPAITLTGAGTLDYDEFGNLTIEIRADEQSTDLLRAAGVEIRDGVISSGGRAVVDMQHRTLTYIMSGEAVGTPAAGPLSPSRPRHWEVQGDLLVLSTRDEAGKPLSTGRWRKVP